MIITIASGKGGTGKTAISTNLALALARQGQQIQLVDCDVEEPNAHLFFAQTKAHGEPVFAMIPRVQSALCTGCGTCVSSCAFHALTRIAGQVLLFPELCHGCGGCILACPQQAIEEDTQQIGEVFTAHAPELDLIWGRTKVGTMLAGQVVDAVRSRIQSDTPAIIDAPPGATCLAVAAIMGADFCVLVTEPTVFGLHDLQLATQMTRELSVPVGVVVNRVGVDKLADNSIQQYCQQHDIPILLQIPFNKRLAACYAQGQLWVDKYPTWQKEFETLWTLALKQAR